MARLQNNPPAGETRELLTPEVEEGARVPLWPRRLLELATQVRDGPDREKAQGEAWLLLHTALMRYLRYHAGKSGPVSREDLEDIASRKSLDLLRRLSSGGWNLTGRFPAEVCGYLSRVAHHGLLDLLNEESRRRRPGAEHLDEWVMAERLPSWSAGMETLPDAAVEQREFSSMLVHCAGRLAPRSRMIWFLRVFCELSSKEIAAHPEVRLKANHVDVLLQRTRRAVRDCLRHLGYEREDMPPGSFIEIWRFLRFSRGDGGEER